MKARPLALPRPGFALTIGLGVVGAWLFGASLRHVSGWFDGIGYEVVNSSLQLLIYLCILAVIELLGGAPGRGLRPRTLLPWPMVLAVALATTHEGAEILLYFSSFVHQIGATADALAGAALGLQARHRLSPLWEPAIEFHAAEDLRALGPALLGTARLSGRRKLHWAAGSFAGLDADNPDLSVRGQLEYES